MPVAFQRGKVDRMSECLLKIKLLITGFHEDVMKNTSAIHHWAPLPSLFRAVNLRE